MLVVIATFSLLLLHFIYLAFEKNAITTPAAMAVKITAALSLCSKLV